MLALIPAGCQCAAALRQLVRQAAAARVVLYFVGTGGAVGQLRRLATQAGQRPAQVAMDAHNVLGTTYKPVGLTAILVHADGKVARVASGLRPGLALTPEFRAAVRQSSGQLTASAEPGGPALAQIMTATTLCGVPSASHYEDEESTP